LRIYDLETSTIALQAIIKSSGLTKSVPLALLYKQNKSTNPITPENLSLVTI